MAGSVRWLVDKRVILIEVTSALTLEDFVEINEQMERNHQEGIAPIHEIVDSRGLITVNVNPLQIRSTLKYMSSPKWGWGIFVTESRLSGMLAAIVYQMTRHRHKIVRTLEEAAEHLEEVGETLAGALLESVRSLP